MHRRIKDLNLSRSGTLKQKLPVHGYLESSIDLTRDAATLRFLRITAPRPPRACLTAA